MVNRVIDTSASADTNYDSGILLSSRQEPSVVEDLAREVALLRRELLQVRQELEQIKQERRENESQCVPALDIIGKAPTGQWSQIYFRAPFTVEKATKLLGECIKEDTKKKLLNEESPCEVELVVGNVKDPAGWQALRLTCEGTRSVPYRSCVLAHVRSKQLEGGLVSTKKPSPQSPLYRKPAQEPPLYAKLTCAELIVKIDDASD